MNVVEGFRGTIVSRVWPILFLLSLKNIEEIGWIGSLVNFTLLALSFIDFKEN